MKVAKVKRERVKEEECEIPQDMLDAMASDIAASETLIKKRQDARPAGDGQISIKCIIKGYKIKQKDGFPIQSATPPDFKITTSKKDAKKSYPEPLVVYAQVLTMDTVPGVCEPLPDGGGWRVRVKLAFAEEAKQWLEAHFWDYYDGKLKTRVPVDSFITPEGTMTTHRWINIQFKSIIQIKISDSEGNIFHKKTPEGNFEVSPLTQILFSACAPEQWVGTRDDKDSDSEAVGGEEAEAAAATTTAVKEKVPQGYTSFNSKGTPILSDDHDPNMPPTERMHASINLDVHNLIPVEDLRANKPCPNAVEFYASSKYHSRMGTENGVSIFKMRVDDLADFYRVFNEKPKVSYSIRLNVFQWHKEPALSDKYSVKIVSTKDNPDLWRAMGIFDPKTFGYIAHANPDIACWVEATLWRGMVCKADINKPENIHDNTALRNIRGHYTYGFKSLMFDFLRYFPSRGLQISKERVVKEFDAWTGTSNRTKETTMTLESTRDVKIPNPLHYAGIQSPVLSLGNNAVKDAKAKILEPLNHGISGNIWPIMDDCDFYVLTSHVLTVDERSMYCGDSATEPLEAHDRFLDNLIDAKVLYWIYAVRRDAVERYSGTKYIHAAVAAPVVPATPVEVPSVTIVPKTKKTKVAEPEKDKEEEEEEAPKRKPAASKKTKVVEPEPEKEESAMDMELEDDEAPAPTPKRKPSNKKK